MALDLFLLHMSKGKGCGCLDTKFPYSEIWGHSQPIHC